MDHDTGTTPWRLRTGGSTGIEEYDSNPFIACLPPPPSEDDTFAHLKSLPPCTDAERMLAPHLREQLVFIRIKQAFIPVSLQLRQANQIDLLLRGGYVSRNPSTAAYQAMLTDLATRDEEELAADIAEGRGASDMAADSLVILGPSGIGKTTLQRRMLDAYPQVKRHSAPGMGTITQIVWLRIETAADGSPKQTILSMFAAIDGLLGTDYVGKHGALPRERLLVKAQQLCARHAIGMIVVDEIQNLANSSAGQSDLMSFLTSLVNVVNVPIVMIGTMKALGIFGSNFRIARRGEGNGSIIYEPMPNDAEWRTFVRTLFRFQWTTERTEWSQEISDLLWDESQGIIDIAVKLFVLSQMRAIRLGARGKSELISTELVRLVAEQSLKLVRPMLDALRRRDWKALEQYDDLTSVDAMIAAELQKRWKGADAHPDLSSLAEAVAERLDGPGGEVANGLMTAALAASGLAAEQIAAVVAMVKEARGSPDPVAAVVTAVAPKPTKSKKAKHVESAPVNPGDVRVAAAGGDPMAGLAEADLLRVA